MFNFNLLIKKLKKQLLSIFGSIESFFKIKKHLLSINRFIEDFFKIKKHLLSINRFIEGFFNSFQKYKLFKKYKIENTDKRIPLGASLIIILILTYFLIPAYYNKNEVKILLQNQIFDEYDIKVKFDGEIKYNLFPKPHFSTKNLLITHDEDDIVKSNHTKIYVSAKKFFSLKKLKIKDLVLKKAEFSTSSSNINFFLNVLNSKKNQNKVIIKNSNLFYKDKNKDVIFLLKIKKLYFLYDKKNLEHKMFLNSEIFNIPIKLKIRNNLKSKKTIIKLSSKKIRLKVENEIKYDQESIDGLLSILIMSKKNLLSYQIKNNSLNFTSIGDDFNGLIDLKPFYFLSDLNFDQLNLKKMFKDSSILRNFLNSEILNNQNLNANFNINFNKINSSNHLSKFILKTYLEEGNLIIKDSSINWHNAALINLNDIQLYNEKNETKLNGEISVDFNDVDKFYSYYQVKRKYRKNLQQIKLDFTYDLNQKKITLDNARIDNKTNKNINNFLNQFNFQENINFNKVTFRNFVKNFFSTYSG